MLGIDHEEPRREARRTRQPAPSVTFRDLSRQVNRKASLVLWLTFLATAPGVRAQTPIADGGQLQVNT